MSKEIKEKIIEALEEDDYLMEDKSICLECKKEFIQETDIQLCQECMGKFDVDKIWELHDSNKLDALNFNESKNFRERFRK